MVQVTLVLKLESDEATVETDSNQYKEGSLAEGRKYD